MNEPSFMETLGGLAARHSLSKVQTAALLGVLCLVETMAPDLLAALVPE